MKVLLVHNRYREPGGEDMVFAAEEQLLRGAGHQVIEYVRDNNEIALNGFVSRARLAAGTLWAGDSLRDLREILRRESPDIAHFHNTLPLISPSAYYACREAGVPVVQTLHNYRLLCPAATFFREGHLCEDCIEHNLGHSVYHGCYRQSRTATAAVAAMLAIHRWKGTWTEAVDRYIALTGFARAKFVAAGLPESKVSVKPNFVAPDPGPRSGPGEYALFVGRLSREKGLRSLLRAWRGVDRGIPLRIVGDGPLGAELRAAFNGADSPNVRFEGWQSREQTLAAMKAARFLVFPSELYECFPVTLAEAFACGVPVIASRLGAMAEIVEHGRTGLLFEAGNADDLATKVEWAWTHPAEMQEMGRAARAEYEAKYTAERNYRLLMEIYERVLCSAA